MSVVAPALRGDDALGFLAAVGIVALSEQERIPPVRLSWQGRSAPVAAFEAVASLDQLGTELSGAFESLRAQDEVIPGAGPDFPLPPPQGKTAGGDQRWDRMRMPRDEMAQLFTDASRRWVEDGDRWFARWLLATAGQAAAKDKGDIELTPFYAPTGRMSLRGSLFDATVKAVEAAGGPADALTRWRRVAFDGANFDDRAKRDAAVTTTGEASNRAAPSATWLAVMAIRMFPMTDDGRTTRTVGWQRVRLYRGFTYRSLVWPIWSMPLDSAGVRTLLAHPLLQLEGPPDAPHVARFAEDQLRALGITAVFGSSRRTLQQGDGPLGPAVRLWPAATPAE